MTEAEYLAVSDLARVRAARGILRDILPGDAVPQSEMREIHRTLEKWEASLNARIRLSP